MDASFRHFPMRAAAPVDLEMLYESWGLQCAAEIEAVLGTAPRVWRWLQQKLRVDEAQVAKEELLPLPVVFPLSLQHMDFITDNFAGIKTELQLIHGAVDEVKTELQRLRGTVDELHEQEKARDTKLDRLQRQVKNISDKPHTPSPDVTGKSSEKAAKTGSDMKADRAVCCPSDMSKLKLVRLEAPVILDRNHVDDMMNYLKTFLSDRLSDAMSDVLGDDSFASQVPASGDQVGDYPDPQLHGTDASQLLQFYQVAARGGQ